ncbi:MAG: DUF3833 family protein [Sphingomicrobium sp.]
MRNPLLLAVSLAIVACSASNPKAPEQSAATLDPIAYFTGHAEGRATLHKIVGSPAAILVHSDGRPDGKGGVLLDQRIEEPGKPGRTRHWHLVPAGSGRFAGTLTDASGPVAATVAGARLEISYPMKGGLKAHQVLILRADGKTLDNRLIVSKLGLQLARVDEVITKQ